MGEIREPLRELTECGLPMALEVMGERWSFMILRASFNGLHHFEEFLSELGIARNILSNRLGRLVEHGILGRQPMAEDRRKIMVRITHKGTELVAHMRKEIAANLADIMSEMDEEEAETLDHARRAVTR